MSVSPSPSPRSLTISIEEITAPTRVITLDEVAKHNKEGDAWIIISGKVYDISGFKHPGGFKALSQYLGGDGTVRFKRIHIDWQSNLSRLDKFLLGYLAT